ncbi:hypothetical protein GLOIN_2v1770931 [Rhizophagus irregularis DAOM 181602=DAOM 197198]|nr:hypothetical protein GLOIN_2v1770931 [Rhizophagus irregularis DAOM 181602=DAOM 197198]
MPRHKKSSKGHSWVQISNDSTVGDDESIWDEGDQPTTSYNIARKLSKEYTTEEKTSAKKDEGNYHLLPSSIDVKQNKDRQNETRVLHDYGNYNYPNEQIVAESLPDGNADNDGASLRSSDSYEFVPDAPLPTYEQTIENGWLV